MAVADKLTSFARKPLPEKCAALDASLRESIDALSGRTFRRSMLYQLREIRKAVRASALLEKERYLAEALNNARFADPKRLERHGLKVYSQYDEDGIIEEIFRRIGVTDRRFIEFGVGDGLENNTLKLLVQGWHGLWIEADPRHVAAIESRFRDPLGEQRLTLRRAFITAENINDLIQRWGEGDIDLLSIDIDGNDYYVWQAINVIRARVVVIEYNGKFPPSLSIVQKYRPDSGWQGTDYFGASLQALARLGRRLGYSLVGTNFAGINAFFVRGDLAAASFQAPFTAENHYNQAKYFLWELYVAGHPPDWGAYIEVPESGADQPDAKAIGARVPSATEGA